MSETEWLDVLRQEKDPDVVYRMRTGWVVLGSTQHLPGYCLLVHDSDADHLTDLSREDRSTFLFDLSLLGEAVQQACSAEVPGFDRVNYEVLGNLWPHLHAHVHARYAWESQERRQSPVWLYGEERTAEEHHLGPSQDRLRSVLRDNLEMITAEAYRDNP